jgi:hypothetical protein
MLVTVYLGMLKLSAEQAKLYTPEQQACIEKYAAGLLISMVGPIMPHIITPDIGDGFDNGDTMALFGYSDDEVATLEAAGKEPLLWTAHGDVVQLLDDWFESLAKQVGFPDMEAAWDAAKEQEEGRVPNKYPTWPTEEPVV